MTESQSTQSIHTLITSNLYDPSIVTQLEQYVTETARHTSPYDQYINTHLLSIYCISPDTINSQSLIKLLLLQLTHLPSTDYINAYTALPHTAHTNIRELSSIHKLYNLLTSCQFKKFWNESSTISNITQSITQFDNNVRQFIALCIQQTYTTITMQQLKEYTNLSLSKDIDQLITNNNWSKSADSTAIHINTTNDNRSATHTARQQHDQFSVECMYYIVLMYCIMNIFYVVLPQLIFSLIL